MSFADDIIFQPIPGYGDLMSLDDFKEAVQDKMFIDYDGHGNLSNGKEMSTIRIIPSQVANFVFPEWATHIMWFNR